MTTKEKILQSALSLFSEYGYNGVGIDQIAEVVGIKGPSLYKHFKGKNDLLNSLIDYLETYYAKNFGSFDQPNSLPQSIDDIIQNTLARIHFTMNDPLIQKTRRFLAQEQFRNERLARIASLHYLDGLQQMHQSLFQSLMDQELFQQGEADMIAMEFVAPITVLIHTYDRQPERGEELWQRIEHHIRYFFAQHSLI